MRKLREHGFTNRDIRVIIHDRWKEPTIKKYTRGVKPLSTEERDKLLRSLADFSSEGYAIQDLNDFTIHRQSLDSIGLDYHAILEFVEGNMNKSFNLADLIHLNKLYKNSDPSIEEIIKNSEILEDLNNQGIYDQELFYLNNMARAYGGIKGIYDALEQYGNIETIKKAEIQTRNNLSILQLEYTKLEGKSTSLKPFVDFAETLITKYSFNLESLDTLVKVAEKYGGSTSILIALTEYNSLHDLRLEKANEIILFENFKRITEAKNVEYSNSFDKVLEMHEYLGEIKANYGQSLRLQILASLLTKPREIQIDAIEFLRIVSAILSGILEYAEMNRGTLMDLKEIQRSLESCRIKINDIIIRS